VATEKLVNALKAGFPLAGEDVREGQDG